MTNKFKLGDRVRVYLYDRRGILIGTVAGKVSDFAPDTEVAPGMRKNLVWVTSLEGYERPNDLGQMEAADEGWFADTDLEKIDEEHPYRLFSN